VGRQRPAVRGESHENAQAQVRGPLPRASAPTTGKRRTSQSVSGLTGDDRGSDVAGPEEPPQQTRASARRG
jgi:hypothetical protein